MMHGLLALREFGGFWVAAHTAGGDGEGGQKYEDKFGHIVVPL
jgi:hypothetical protein